jgi:hypothetical protein
MDFRRLLSCTILKNLSGFNFFAVGQWRLPRGRCPFTVHSSSLLNFGYYTRRFRPLTERSEAFAVGRQSDNQYLTVAHSIRIQQKEAH